MRGSRGCLAGLALLQERSSSKGVGGDVQREGLMVACGRNVRGIEVKGEASRGTRIGRWERIVA